MAGHKPFDSRTHFLGRLVGEGQGENLGRRDPVFQEPGNPVRHDARLAAARPGKNQQRPFDVADRFALGRVQSLEQMVGHGHSFAGAGSRLAGYAQRTLMGSA